MAHRRDLGVVRRRSAVHGSFGLSAQPADAATRLLSTSSNGHRHPSDTSNHDLSKSIGQKISYGFAIACFLAAIATALGVLIDEPRADMDPIQGSLIATAFLFGSCAVVQYVIGTARLKGDPSRDKDA